MIPEDFNMKTLAVVQKLSKIAKVISKIVFICSIVGFCGCVAGIVFTALGADALKIGGITISGLIQKEAGVSAGTLYASMASGAVICAGEAVLAQFAFVYFRNEVDDGTPFIMYSARRLQTLGILTICISFGTRILASIIHSIFVQTMSGVAAADFSSIGSVSLGIMFIVTAQICKYGAELRRKYVKDDRFGFEKIFEGFTVVDSADDEGENNGSEEEK